MRINDNGILINYHDDPAVTRLEIPPEVKKIAPHAFYGCEYLEEIIIPDGVDEIGTSAFENCRELKSVTMPDTVEDLGKAAFKDCRKLTNVRISSGLYEIPSQAFDCCHSLTAVDVPEGVAVIGYDSFNGCFGLTSVSLPDSIGFIDNGAFMETFSLKSIAIPDRVEDIGSYTFYRSGLELISYRGMEIYIDKTDKNFQSLEFSFTKGLQMWLANGCRGQTVMPKYLQDPFRIAHFTKTGDRRLLPYIKKNFARLFKTTIRTGNIPAVNALIGINYLSMHNINVYINYAAEQRQHEIYLMLMAHKETLGGKSRSASARLRL